MVFLGVDNNIPGIKKLKREEVLNNLGYSYYRLNKYNEAEYYFNNCLKINDKNFFSNVYLAHSYFEGKKVHEAIGQYSKVVSIVPDKSDDYFYNYNVGLSHQILGNLEKATVFFSKALEIEPNDTKALFFAAECYSLLNKKDEAIKLLRILYSNDNETLRLIKNNRSFAKLVNDGEFIKVLKSP